jgi:hypothetical protein
LQDYRLPAVPLAGEPKVENHQDGCELGTAPSVELSPAPASGNAFAVRVTVDDPDHQPSETSHPLSIDWGDGSISTGAYRFDQPDNVFTHVYAGTGKYRVAVAVENGSGLRGLADFVVQVEQADASVH